MMPRIMIVDDSLFMRHTIRKLLEIKEYDLVEASGVDEALVKLQTNSVDLILLDYLMPHRDGVELLRELRGFAPRPACIVLTADLQEGTVRECEELGAARVLHKPPQREALLGAIEEVLGTGGGG